jgi:hypothetical protein
VEDVNKWRTGERWLLQTTSTDIFNYLHNYAVLPRYQRQAWKKREYMESADQGRYCIGCRWKVADHLHDLLLTIVPSIMLEQAEVFIARGRLAADNQRARSTFG